MVEDNNKGTRTCLGFLMRFCSFCGIIFGVITLLFNMVQVGEIEYGNPEGVDVITGNKDLDKHANAVMDSSFYTQIKKGTLLPQYEALAVEYHSDLGKSPRDIKKLEDLMKPIGRIVFEESDARTFVFLYFIVTFITLLSSCVCFRASDVTWEMENDA